MSENFIPLTQSTPVNKMNKQWPNQNYQQSGQLGNRGQNTQRGGFNRPGNNSHNSQRNNSFRKTSSRGKDCQPIEAYLHPSMLQDPWSYLRRRYSENQ